MVDVSMIPMPTRVHIQNEKNSICDPCISSGPVFGYLSNDISWKSSLLVVTIPQQITGNCALLFESPSGPLAATAAAS